MFFLRLLRRFQLFVAQLASVLFTSTCQYLIHRVVAAGFGVRNTFPGVPQAAFMFIFMLLSGFTRFSTYTCCLLRDHSGEQLFHTAVLWNEFLPILMFLLDLCYLPLSSQDSLLFLLAPFAFKRLPETTCALYS